MKGYLAISRAGHDKGRIYVIMEEDGEYVYVSDGNLRQKEYLKKKNKKHIQIIKKSIIEPGETVTNEQIKREIKLYNGGNDSGGIN